MTDLVVRKLLVDMQAPLAPRWNGGDAFRTALFNALSMSFRWVSNILWIRSAPG